MFSELPIRGQPETQLAATHRPPSGIERTAIRRALDQGTRTRKLQLAPGGVRVVEHGGMIAGYASDLRHRGHAVATSNEALKAMLLSGQGPGGGLIPSRNTELLTWCLASGLRIEYPTTLMTIGLHNEPAGAYLPSIIV